MVWRLANDGQVLLAPCTFAAGTFMGYNWCRAKLDFSFA